MRTIETIDAELRVLVTVRRSILELGGKPRTAVVDQLLDERFEIRTATGKSTVLQCALSGGPNTVSSHVRQSKWCGRHHARHLHRDSLRTCAWSTGARY